MTSFVSRNLGSIAAAATLLAGCAHGFGNGYAGNHGARGGYSSYRPTGYSGGHFYSPPPPPSAPIARSLPPPSPPIVSARPSRPPPMLAYGYVAPAARPVSVVLDLLDLISQGFADALAAPGVVVVEPAPAAAPRDPAPPPPLPPPPQGDELDRDDDPRPPAPGYYGADLGAEVCDALAPGAPLPRGCKPEELAKSKALPTPPPASGSGAAGSPR